MRDNLTERQRHEAAVAHRLRSYKETALPRGRAVGCYAMAGTVSTPASMAALWVRLRGRMRAK